jgi:hypothetical protein
MVGAASVDTPVLTEYNFEEIRPESARPPPLRVEAGTPVTVFWQVRVSGGATTQVALSGARNLSSLQPSGSVSLTEVDMRSAPSLTLTAQNACGSLSATLTVNVFRKLYLSLPAPAFDLGASAVLTVRSSCPVPSDVTVALAARNPDAPTANPRVSVAASAVIAAGQDRTTVALSAALGGNQAAFVAGLIPAEPASVVSAGANAHEGAAIPVWVTPPGGQAMVVTPVVPNVVAVHVALLRNGKVPAPGQRSHRPRPP